MRRLVGLALVAMMMACGFAARAEEGEYDPAKVSESLKAIFQFGSADTKKALNANTVTLISGTIGGTYVQFGADLASVLDDGNKLRVLPIVGRGSVQSVADILFLQGVDLGIVRSDTLDYLEKKGFAKDIKKQFTYVTKLYNEEMHVIASKSVHNLKELNGKTISDGNSFADLVLNEAQVALVGGNDFGAPEHIRMSYATSTDKINGAFDRIAAAVKKLQK